MSPTPATLFVHAGALGDFTLTMHLAERHRTATPGVRLHALCRCRLACYLARRGRLAGWKFIETRRFAALWGAATADEAEMRRYFQPFTTVVALLGAPDHPTCQRLRGWFDGHLVTLDPRAHDSGHIVDQWATPLTAAGLALAHSGQMEVPRAAGGAGVVIHPGSGGRAKCWPLDHFLHVADVARRGRGAVRFMIGPDEIERCGPGLIARLEEHAPVMVHEDICDAAAALTSTDLYIGNDAGMTHVAALMGVQTLAIFTTTDPRVWRPPGLHVTVAVEPTVDEIVQRLG